MGEWNEQSNVNITKLLKPYTELQMRNWENTNKIEVRKIIKSHGRDGKEQERGQVVVTVFDFHYIPEIMGNPDTIEHGGTYFNKPVLKFTRGNRTIVAVVSKKHLDIFVQTMYIKKKSLATTPDDKHIFPHTSETFSGTASNDSIPKKRENTTLKEELIHSKSPAEDV